MINLKELARILECELIGDETRIIKRIDEVDQADIEALAFAAKKKFIEKVKITKAGALIVPKDFDLEIPKVALLKSFNPYYSWAKALEFFYKDRINPDKSGINPKSDIDNTVKIGKNVYVGPFVVIEKNATIEDNCRIEAGTFIGRNTTIKKNSIIHPNVTIREYISIGKNVIIHSGTVIGSDGYGFIKEKGRHYKIPQIGSVIIEDDVEIGSNVSIDRAAKGFTIIGKGTKIDNLVHLAHGVNIKENCLILGQVGIAGSTVINSNVTLAGQVGVIGHLNIGENTTVAARSVVTGNIQKNSFVSGFPAIPHKDEMRIKATQRKLPEILKTVQQLKKCLLEKKEKK